MNGARKGADARRLAAEQADSAEDHRGDGPQFEASALVEPSRLDARSPPPDGDRRPQESGDRSFARSALHRLRIAAPRKPVLLLRRNGRGGVGDAEGRNGYGGGRARLDSDVRRRVGGAHRAFVKECDFWSERPHGRPMAPVLARSLGSHALPVVLARSLGPRHLPLNSTTPNAPSRGRGFHVTVRGSAHEMPRRETTAARDWLGACSTALRLRADMSGERRGHDRVEFGAIAASPRTSAHRRSHSGSFWIDRITALPLPKSPRLLFPPTPRRRSADAAHVIRLESADSASTAPPCA